MSVDLLRQLDAYGEHVASLIDHVDADEVEERALLAGAEGGRAKPRWRRPLVLATSTVGVFVVAIAGLAFFTSGGSDDAGDPAANFQEIGDLVGDGDGGADATAAPTTAGAGRALEQRSLSAFGDESALWQAQNGVDFFQTETTVPSGTGAPTTTTAPGVDEPDAGALAGRDIVFVGTIAVSVSDAEGAGDRATLIVESLGGFLAGERSTGGANATTVLTFKVPPAAFRDAVDRLGDLGVVTDREVTADDVTERVVDLESQIQSAEISVERLRAFLAEAANVNDVAKLERELTNRERDLEQLRGQLTTIESRVALATILVSFSEAIETPKVGLDTTAYVARDDDGASCPGARPLELEAGEDATLCIQITNRGRTQLTDIELTGPAVDELFGSLITVEGDLNDVLEPGEVIVLATDVGIDARTRSELTVTAVPVNEAGDPVPDRAVTQTKRVAIDIADPGGLPGFGDAWDRGTSALATAGGIALIFFGAILPWLWLPALIILFVWWRRRR